MRGPDQKPGQRPSISRPLETHAQYRARMLAQIKRADDLRVARNGGVQLTKALESGVATPAEMPFVQQPASPTEE